jgi:hypothetical protein
MELPQPFEIEKEYKRKEYTYMIPLMVTTITMDESESKDIKRTHEQLVSDIQIREINQLLTENLKNERYKMPMKDTPATDQIIMHWKQQYGEFPSESSIKKLTHYIVLFIRTLEPIEHPLFLSCQAANSKFKFAYYCDFNSVYDCTPGMRFDKRFTGTFFDLIDDKVKFNC